DGGGGCESAGEPGASRYSRPASPAVKERKMQFLLKRRLQLQLLFILLAAVLIAALSVILITDAVKSAEGVVLTDASKTLANAVSELDQQFRDRTSVDSAWHEIPVAAQDTSLRGVSQA